MATSTADLAGSFVQATLFVGHVAHHGAFAVRVERTDHHRHAIWRTHAVLVGQINLPLFLNGRTFANLDLAALVALHHASSPTTYSAHNLQSVNW